MCARPRNVEEDYPGVAHVRHGEGRRLPRRPARRENMCAMAIDTVIRARALGASRSTATPRGAIDQRRSGSTRGNHGEVPVRARASRPTDRPHDPADVYQQCIKRTSGSSTSSTCLDLLMEDDPQCAGVVAYELGDRRAARVQARRRCCSRRRLTAAFFKITSNAHALTGERPAVLVPRDPARGHGDASSSTRRGCTRWGSALRGGARLRRHPAERLGRTLHGAIRADDQGPRAARHGIPRDLPGGQEGRGINGSDYVYLDVRQLPAT
jgi:succinate dehydrogenase / fumarate reductase flavoprotein subunit